MTDAGYFMSVVLLLFVVFTHSHPAESSELEYRIYAGLWTEHYRNDDPKYNESNDLVQLSVYTDNLYFGTAGTFKNSHYARSHFLGFGREFKNEYVDDLSWGLLLAAVHGYEGELKTHWQGLIFIPITYYKYRYLRVTILGPVINAGIEVPF